MKTVYTIMTAPKENLFFKESRPAAMIDENTFDEEYVELNVVNVYPQEEAQTLLGFGGAFTEAAGYCFSKLSKENQDKIAKLYFDKEEGIGYSLGRVHMNSCDFSLGNYACCEKESENLEGFSLNREKQYMLPMIHACQKNAGITFLMSPWSPPKWMKSNGEMNHGGTLLPQYRQTWADYYVAFLSAMQAQGVEIQYITVQNEPYAVQTWDSCIFTAEDERDFVKDYLGPTLARAGLGDVKILVWDHNKERAYEHVKEVFQDPEAEKYIWGTAFHWYSGDHFEALDLIQKKWPQKQLMMTECCVDLTCPSQQAAAERYAHEIIGDFQHGTVGFLDWNLILDETGGPNHVGNFCDAPIRVNVREDQVQVGYSYYYIGHFSRFLPRGSVRVATTGYCQQIEHLAFRRQDRAVVVILLNRTDRTLPVILRMEGLVSECRLPGHSIVTAIIEDEKC